MIAGRHLAHRFDRRLVGEEVAAVNRVVEVFPGRVAFAFGVDGAVDAALRADRMRTLHRNDREQIDRMARLSDLHAAARPASPPPTIAILIPLLAINRMPS